MKPAVRIAITGTAGQIGYSILFRIAAGEMFGSDQPIILHLLERDNLRSQSALQGVLMELMDSAFPLVQDVVTSKDPRVVFRDVDYALLIGARPRGPGMERGDLLEANASIFKTQGQVINEVAKRDVKVLVVGNPCNTNAWIAAKSAPDLPASNFTALLRLDQNRAIAQIAQKVQVAVSAVEHVAVWGNHSPTMVPDLRFALANGEPVINMIELNWVTRHFIPTVARRGSAIIEARGVSSAASAAGAAIAHMRDWALGSNGRWVTMGVPSTGVYGVERGIVFGFPCICENGSYRIVEGLRITPEIQARIDKTLHELHCERAVVESLF